MTGQSILITGCSSGIGLCAATLLKERGYRVFATARKADDVESLKAQGFESLQLDVNDSASMQAAVAQIVERTGGTLDALFNNSGYVLSGAIEDLTREQERAQFETNVFGVMELTRLVLPIMRKQGHGRIIQNSSILGVLSFPYSGAYSASKFALEGFNNALRLELRGTNIYVSLINPGPIDTKIRDNAYKIFKESADKFQAGHYKDMYKKLERSYFNPDKPKDKYTLGPEAVVKQVIHALESKHPKAHYFIGMPAKIMALMKRILPDSVMDWLLSKAQ